MLRTGTSAYDGAYGAHLAGSGDRRYFDQAGSAGDSGLAAQPAGGIVTRDPAKAAPYGVPSWESLEAALAACPAEAVYIATPVFVHAAQTIAALRAGRHVLCEKPMAMDYQQAVTIEQAAEETGRTLGIAYYRRMYRSGAGARTARPRRRRASGFRRGYISRLVLPGRRRAEWLLDRRRPAAGRCTISPAIAST